MYLPGFLAILFLAERTTAHFLLNYPPSLGFDDNNEDAGPCGGFTPSFGSASSYHVGGDAIALTTLHPQSNFRFRAALDPTASENWTDLLPIVGEYSLGAFCEQSVPAPDAWAGKQGVLQVIQHAEDGVHYQCAAVNFVAGALSSLPSSCTNASGLTASFTDDATLLPATAQSSSSMSSPASTAVPYASSTTKPSSASSIFQNASGSVLLCLAMAGLGVAVGLL